MIAKQAKENKKVSFSYLVSALANDYKDNRRGARKYAPPPPPPPFPKSRTGSGSIWLRVQAEEFEQSGATICGSV